MKDINLRYNKNLITIEGNGGLVWIEYDAGGLCTSHHQFYFIKSKTNLGTKERLINSYGKTLYNRIMKAIERKEKQNK